MKLGFIVLLWTIKKVLVLLLLVAFLEDTTDSSSNLLDVLTHLAYTVVVGFTFVDSTWHGL